MLSSLKFSYHKLTGYGKHSVVSSRVKSVRNCCHLKVRKKDAAI